MTNEQDEKDHKKKVTKKIALVTVLLVSVFALLILTTFSHNSARAISLSELPVDKLEHGYDMVCKARDHQQFCVIKHDSKTLLINPAYQLHLVNKDNKTDIGIAFKISSIGDCIREFHVEKTNQTTQCNSAYFFPFNSWNISETTVAGQFNGTLIEMENNTKI